MNQEVTVQKALNSISIQLGGLTTKQNEVIGSHLYLVYGAGIDAKSIITQSTSKKIVCISPSNKEYSYNSIREASRSLKLRRDDIKNVLEGTKPNYKGYKFRYD